MSASDRITIETAVAWLRLAAGCESLPVEAADVIGRSADLLEMQLAVIIEGGAS